MVKVARKKARKKEKEREIKKETPFKFSSINRLVSSLTAYPPSVFYTRMSSRWCAEKYAELKRSTCRELPSVFYNVRRKPSEIFFSQNIRHLSVKSKLSNQWTYTKY